MSPTESLALTPNDDGVNNLGGGSSLLEKLAPFVLESICKAAITARRAVSSSAAQWTNTVNDHKGDQMCAQCARCAMRECHLLADRATSRADVCKDKVSSL